MSFWWLSYVGLGLASGLFAGLLGVGGGAVMVPILTLIFAAQQFPQQYIVHMALGTSMATIMFTSLSSARAHHRHGAVRWEIVTRLAPGIIAGTLAGAQLAAHLATRPLAIFFALFMSFVALQMVIDATPAPTRRLPGSAGMVAVGAGIGAISALVAIGGGSMAVPFMTACNVKLREAIGTSAALGFPIAVSGTMGYLVAGHAADLPAGSFGYIYLPALAGMVVPSMLTAPVGARLGLRLAPRILKRVFAAVLLLLIAKMLYSLR